MDEMTKMVSQRTGLPEDKSRMAAQAVMDYITNHLPTPVANQVRDAVMSGKGTGDMGNMSRGMGGSMGQR